MCTERGLRKSGNDDTTAEQGGCSKESKQQDVAGGAADEG